MEGDCDIICGYRSGSSISIHSLRMEGDQKHRFKMVQVILFQSTPSAWRETKINCGYCGYAVFQSTPSAWRETTSPFCISTFSPNFNPLPPHGGRQEEALARTANYNISIHSLRMEGDSIHTLEKKRSLYFNPLPPHGGRLHAAFFRKRL